MNERVKAILFTAFKLSPEERQELAQALMETLAVDSPEAEHPVESDGGVSGSLADGTPQQPTSDVLAKYLDV